MKKTLSIIMALCMVLSVCFFSVSAAEAAIGTVAADYKPAEGAVAVTTEAEFLAMAADGNYYLANDITLTKTYAQAPFTGTFDGCGKTITISTPLFANLGGTVKNLTINGEVTAITKDGSQSDGGHMASIACYSSKNDTIVIENICNNANISGGETSGGIYGYVRDGSDLTIKNCINNGSVTGTGQTAGMIGYSQGKTAVIENCVNNGTISTSSYGAGIIGRFGKNAAAATEEYSITITNCINNGSISSGKDQCGGIMGYTTGGIVSITNCHNTGNIDVSTAEKDIAVGGILGSSKSEQSSAYFKQNISIIECTNSGNLKSKIRVGGIVGYGRAYGEAGTPIFQVIGCINTGNIEATKGAAGGIVAHFGASKHVGYYVADKCINLGTVTSSSTSHGSTAGGIVGYAYGTSSNEYPVITNCYSAGNVTATATHASGLLGYCNTDFATIHDNYVVCKVTGVASELTAGGKVVDGVFTAPAEGETIVVGAAPASLVVYWNNLCANNETLVYNNYYLEGTAESYLHSKTNQYFTDSNSDGVADKDVIGFNRFDKTLADTAADSLPATALSSGEIAYKVNALFGATVLSQKIGTDAAPVLGDNDIVYLMADGTYSNTDPSSIPETTEPAPETTEPAPETTEPAPEPTEPAPETTEPGSSTPTGDSALIFAVIAVISVLGVAVVAKKREN